MLHLQILVYYTVSAQMPMSIFPHLKHLIFLICFTPFRLIYCYPNSYHDGGISERNKSVYRCLLILDVINFASIRAGPISVVHDLIWPLKHHLVSLIQLNLHIGWLLDPLVSLITLRALILLYIFIALYKLYSLIAFSE